MRPALLLLLVLADDVRGGKGEPGDPGMPGASVALPVPYDTTGYDFPGPAITAQNAGTGGALHTEGALSADTPGVALEVTGGRVDLANANVRLPVHVREFLGPNPDNILAVYSYCNPGGVLFAGGCHKNGGAISMGRMVLCDRGDLSAFPALTSANPPSNCVALGSSAVPAAANNASSQAFYVCELPQLAGGNFFAQAICLDSF